MDRSVYMDRRTWAVKIWEISDLKIVNSVCGYSKIHITCDLHKYLNQRYCFTRAPTFNHPSRKFTINYGRMDRVWCEKDCYFRPWVPFLLPSIQLHTSQISHLKNSFFSIRKANFIFMFGCSKFCSGSWWIIFGVSTNANESSMTYRLKPNGTRSK